jgi:hypothetical protein
LLHLKTKKQNKNNRVEEHTVKSHGANTIVNWFMKKVVFSFFLPYSDQDTAHHQGGDDPALAHLTPYPGSDMARR